MSIMISILNRHSMRFVSQSDGLDAELSGVRSDPSSVSRFRVSASWFQRHRFALILLVLFVLVGVWVLDDYGVGTDTGAQRWIATHNLDYLLGKSDLVFSDFHRFYGVSYELPLLLLERVLGLEDTRDVHLMRHILTHLFFLTSGFFCYLLAYRLFNNRLLALLAMLLFLLNPRVYAHSFFNSKDAPFLSMFMICLYLTHRSFERDNVWRFLVLGIAMGVLINLRIMGVTLFALVAGMQVLNLLGASNSHGRRRVLGSMGTFVLSILATLYVVSPGLWDGPAGNFVEWFAAFSQHPSPIYQMFRGDLILSIDVNPPEYVPVWMSITTLPVTFALGFVGTLGVLIRGLIRPHDLFYNSDVRFGLLLISCLLLSVLAVIVLDVNVYYGWRQMYFLYAPFCLLAVFGVHWMMSCVKSTRLRPGMYGAVGAGVAVAVASMSSIHPHQHLYFNFLVDRTTPEHLRSEYDMDYWTAVFREGFEHLLEMMPSSSIHLQKSLGNAGYLNWEVLAEADRDRMILERETSDFYITNYQSFKPLESPRRDGTSPLVYSRVVYGSKVLGVAAVDLSLVDDDVAARYREMHRAAVSGNPAAVSEWDVYVDGAVLTYIKESCVAGDLSAPFFLHVTPDDLNDLPEYRRRWGHSTRLFDFDFGKYGVMFDGKCMAVVPLPDAGISGVRTGQWTSDGELWGVALNMRQGGESAYRAEYVSVVDESPVVSSDFDVYLRDGRLIYVKSRCDASDVEAEFFLRVSPSDVGDLPPPLMDSGFDYLRFAFETRGLIFDGVCVASVDLPDYSIERVRTGQHRDDGVLVWSANYNVSATSDLPSVMAGLRGGGAKPVVRSHFDVYLDGGSLIYFRSSCAAGDVDVPFFVHVYADDWDDLPSGRRLFGFESFSFDLLDAGLMSGDGCFTSFDLPDYDVAGFLTGQFIRGDGNVWEGGHSLVAAELPDVMDNLRRRGSEPDVRSYFDVYLYDGRLIYVRESCASSDVEAKFFLHLVPLDVDDLPLDRRESGFDNLGFDFETHGLMLDGMCMAGVGLPDYDVDRVRTGQWEPELQYNIWEGVFHVGK